MLVLRGRYIFACKSMYIGTESNLKGACSESEKLTNTPLIYYSFILQHHNVVI